MHLITIYDVRNGWTLWIGGTGAVLFMCYGVWIGIATARLFHLESGRAKIRKNTVGLVGFFVMILFMISLSFWFSYDEYVRRSDLSSGRFLETQGVIEEAQIESSGRSNPMYFRIDNRWFKLPYGHPQDCYPHDGETAKLEFEAQADVKHRGAPAHTILRMQLTHTCRIGVWG